MDSDNQPKPDQQQPPAAPLPLVPSATPPSEAAQQAGAFVTGQEAQLSQAGQPPQPDATMPPPPPPAPSADPAQPGTNASDPTSQSALPSHEPDNPDNRVIKLPVPTSVLPAVMIGLLILVLLLAVVAYAVAR